MKHDYSPLDRTSDEIDEENDAALEVATRSSLRWYHLRHFLVYGVLLLSNTVLAVSLMRKVTDSRDADCIRPQLLKSPGRDSIEYQRRRLYRDISEKNPFSGPPRPELDEAWSNIIQPMAIKISAEELKALNTGDETVAFKDGSGYLAELAVYHELHCVKRIRRAFHLDYYYPALTQDELAFEHAHIDHCLEYWREAAMCRGDISLSTLFWRQDGPTSRVYSDHECVNWDILDSWARHRMVNMSDISQFVVPAVKPPVPNFRLGDH